MLLFIRALILPLRLLQDLEGYRGSVLLVEVLSPVEIVIVEVEGFGSFASSVVTFPTSLVGEDSVGEGNFLKLGIGGFF